MASTKLTTYPTVGIAVCSIQVHGVVKDLPTRECQKTAHTSTRLQIRLAKSVHVELGETTAVK